MRDIGSIRFPLASQHRQEELARALLDRFHALTAVRTLMDTSLALFRERKQALLAASVTGQFATTTAQRGERSCLT